ncbi:MAG TPA: hypothetical protein VK176_01850, partial [Phycisphaerales bacterium]|nr:hypothetical protein [Phycisphaerales bacterium]
MASMHGDRNVRGRFGHRARVRGAAIIAAMAGCASCASGDIIQWLSAASGLWSNPSMWEDGNVPNNLNDVAYIGKLGSSYTITVDFDVPMEALTLNSPNATIALNGNRWMYVAAVNPDSFCHIEQGAFNITGGATLKCDREIAVTNPNAVLTMNNGAVEGGVLEINDGGLVSVNTTGYLRTSRTLISDTGQLRVTDGSVVLLDHPGHILEGTGEVLLNGSYYGSRMELRQDAVNAGNIRLSNHPSNSLSGQNLPAADFVLINHGLIHGAGAVGQNTTTFTNTLTGAIIADVSTALYLDPGPAGMLNDGLLGATAGGTLYLQGATYDSSAPGEATIHADNGSRVILNTSAVAIGHTLSTSGTGVIDLSGATLTDDGVNMTHIPGFVRIMDGTAGYFAGAFDLTGDISLASSYYGSVMSMSGDSYFSGGGVVTLANHSGGAVTSTPAHVHWLTNASCTFRGAGQFGANTLGIENLADGTIEAAGSAGLTINPSDVLGLRNEGLLRALGGSSLTLTGAGFDNTGGVVHAADGGRVYLSAAQVTGGTLTTGGSGRIVNSASNSVLRDVTSSGVMDINDGVTTRFESTFTNSGLLNLVGSYYGAVMYIQGGNVLLNGGGTVALSNHPSNVVMAASGELVLTNQDNLITGSGSLGSNQLRIVNNATIEGSASYPLIINPTDAGGVDNNGVLRAAPGGKLFLDGPGFDNQQGVIHADDAGLVNLRSATVIGGQLTASGTGSFTTGASNSLLRDVASSAPVN